MSPYRPSLILLMPAACGSSSTPARPRHRILVLIIIITAVAAMIGTGYEITTAVGAILAVGVAAAEISTRLLGPVRGATLPGT